MRTIKELLQVMLDNQQLFHIGLCKWVTWLKLNGFITNAEDAYLDSYIARHPTKRFRLGDAYYWEPTKIKPRIKWLKKHIELQEQ